MADVQVENGFTRIANQLLEEIAQRKFNGTEFRIIMTVWRYTYGFKRKEHSLSTNFIAEAIGMDNSRVRKVLKDLIDSNVINVTKEATFNQSRILTFNKNFEEWEVEKDRRGQKVPLSPKKTQPEGSKRTQPQGSKSTPKKESIKEIYKESISSSSDTEFAEIIQFYQSNLQKSITESPYNHELINQWYDEWGYDLLLAAMKVAAKQEAKGVAFVEGVLRNWKDAGVSSIDDARKYETEFRNKKSNVRPFKPRKAVGEIDWEGFDLSD